MLRWLFDWFGRLQPRERRVVLGGAVVSISALVVVLLVVPFAQRWAAREALIAASREQWIRLQGLVDNEAAVRRALETQTRARQAEGSRLVVATTPSLAASTLQALIQRYADESMVQINRIDVVGAPAPDAGGLMAVPVRLEAEADIHGLVAFLARVHHGDKLLVVDEMTVTAGVPEASGMQVLSWSIRLHGLYSSTEAGS